MIAEDRSVQDDTEAPAAFWCYISSISGRMVALPDDEHTVLLPYIGPVPQVTPLPLGLVPPYVLGLINVAQRGELLIDLPRMLGLREGPLAPSASEGRRVVVIGEGTPPETEEYRLAFAIDYGYELVEVQHGIPVDDHPLGVYVNEVIDTPRGEAALLNLEAICNTVLHDLGAERKWNMDGTELEGEIN